jgi:hypothetical protein
MHIYTELTYKNAPYHDVSTYTWNPDTGVIGNEKDGRWFGRCRVPGEEIDIRNKWHNHVLLHRVAKENEDEEKQ